MRLFLRPDTSRLGAESVRHGDGSRVSSEDLTARGRGEGAAAPRFLLGGLGAPTPDVGSVPTPSVIRQVPQLRALGASQHQVSSDKCPNSGRWGDGARKSAARICCATNCSVQGLWCGMPNLQESCDAQWKGASHHGG